MKLLDYYSKEPDQIPYSAGDKIKPIFTLNPPVYIVKSVGDYIVKTECDKTFLKNGIRPVGYYNRWIKWSMSVKTL